MKRLTLIVAAGAAAGAAALYALLPPGTRSLPAAESPQPAVRGAFHVHTRRSDGTGTVDEIAAAARRAGLRFVIFTDHGDGTAKHQEPSYRHGVLCIDAVEISTSGGHVIALGMSRSPYPLAGEPRDVVEDIARFGGMSIAAHPGSSKPELRWIDWTAPFDGLEWLNLDSEWRDETRGVLARALLTYPFRRPESLSTLLDRPASVVQRWDELTAHRPVVALAAADAHARLGLPEGGDPYALPAGLLRLPAYEQVFRAISVAIPGIALTGDPVADAATVIGAVRRGAVFSSVDALAQPAEFEFTASSTSGLVAMGPADAPSGPVTFRARTNAPDARVTLLRNGEPVATASGGSLERMEAGAPGVYRVEVHLPDAPGDPPIPWIVSNPIYLRSSAAPAVAPDPKGAPAEFSTLYGDGDAQGWAVEHSPRSKAAVNVVPSLGGTQLLLRFALGGALSESPYAAFLVPPGPALAGSDRLVFTARASRPMRMSVQLRVPDGAGERWRRSVHLDETPREITLPFDEMTPVGRTTRNRPELSRVEAVLFVVDTTNTPPGASGEIYLDDVRYARWKR